MNGVAWTNRLIAAFLAVATLVLARPAPAHDVAYSSLEMRLPPAVAPGAGGDSIRVRLVLHTTEVARELGLNPADEDSLLLPHYLAALATQVRERFAPQLALHTRDGDAIPPLSVAVNPDRGHVGIGLDFRYDARLAGRRFRLRCLPFPRDPAHRTYVSVYARGTIIQHGILLAGDDTMEIDREADPNRERTHASAIEVAKGHFLRGVRHIVAGPDHLLFLLALVLYGGSLPQLVNLVTLFALAQSLTLGLSLLPVTSPPDRVVQSALALSVAGAGIHNLRPNAKTSDWRALLALASGLLHGWASSAQLADPALAQQHVLWALNAFTIGVVVAQAAVALALAAVLRRIERAAPHAMRWIVGIGSWAVVLAGAYWLLC